MTGIPTPSIIVPQNGADIPIVSADRILGGTHPVPTFASLTDGVTISPNVRVSGMIALVRADESQGGSPFAMYKLSANLITWILIPGGSGSPGADGQNAYTNSTAIADISIGLHPMTVASTAWMAPGVPIYVSIFDPSFFDGGGGAIYAKGNVGSITSATVFQFDIRYFNSGYMPSNALVTPSGYDGSNGINAYAITYNNFVVPAVGSSVTIYTYTSTYWMSTGQEIFIGNGLTKVYFTVVSKGYNNVDLRVDYITSGAVGDTIFTGATVSPGGVRGAADGTTGTNGINAYTTTSLNFSQPNISSNVSIQVVKSAWMAIGEIIFVATGGYYQVASIPDATHVTATNLGYTGNASPAITIISGSAISPGGVRGSTGATGTNGATGSTGSTGSTGAAGSAGTAGSTGAAGAAGSTGVNAFTTTNGSITQPATGSTISVTVINTTWMAVGQNLFISNGATFANYSVSSITSSTVVVLKALGYAGDVAASGTIPTAANVSPSGVIGATGTAGAAGAAGPAGAGGSSFTKSFVQADLVSGVLTVIHNLGTAYNVVEVYDNNKLVIIPVSITGFDVNTTKININTFAPITGTWQAIIVNGGSGGGGGGGNLFVDTYANLPVAPPDPTLFIGTDTYSDFIFKGGVWRPRFQGESLGVIPPLATSFTVFGAGATAPTLVNDKGTLIFRASPDTGSVPIAFVSLPVTDHFTARIHAEGNINPTFNVLGLVAIDGTGSSTLFSLRINNSPGFYSSTWAATGFRNGGDTGFTPPTAASLTWWVRIRLVAGSAVFGFSLDGNVYDETSAASVTRAGVTRVGVAMVPYNVTNPQTTRISSLDYA